MTSHVFKKIKFIYEQKEHSFIIAEDTSLQELLNQVKVSFKLPIDTPVGIIKMNIDGDDNSYFIPTSTEHFWIYSSIDMPIPRYRIVTVESKKNIHYF
jgi:hypothetical protein